MVYKTRMEEISYEEKKILLIWFLHYYWYLHLEQMYQQVQKRLVCRKIRHGYPYLRLEQEIIHTVWQDAYRCILQHRPIILQEFR